MPRLLLVSTVAMLLIARPATAEDDPRIFRVLLDTKGAATFGGRSLDEKQLDEALSAATKALPDSRSSSSDLRIHIDCDAETPFSAFHRVFGAAVKARAWDFRITIGGEYVVFALPKDKGLFLSGAKPPGTMRAHLCSTGDAADHVKDWAAHAARAASRETGGNAWIWIEGAEAGPAGIVEDPKAIARVGESMVKAGDTPDTPGAVRVDLEIAADPNVPMKHVFALVGELNHGARYKTADEEKALKSEEGLLTTYPVQFRFAVPGDSGRK